MKQFLLLSLTLITCISCQKEPNTCSISGIYRWSEKEAGKAEILGSEFRFYDNGQMSFGGNDGYAYELTDDCRTLTYWAQKNVAHKHRVPIIGNDGKYLTLDMDSMDGGMGLGIWGLIKLKRM